MRISQSIWIIISAIVILSGCQGARVPLGDSSESQVDSDFVGSWSSTEPSDEDDFAHMKVEIFDEHEYSIEIWEDGDEGKEHEKESIRAFTTQVDGVLFANVHCVDCDDEGEYFFFRFEMSPDGNLKIRGLETDLYSSVLRRFEDSTALRAYVLKHVDDESFYDDEVMLFSRSE